jgi:hypothetical protein
MSKRLNNSWRMCINYISLNKAWPKDMYPLPQRNHIVDSITTSELLSFLEEYMKNIPTLMLCGMSKQRKLSTS